MEAAGSHNSNHLAVIPSDAQHTGPNPQNSATTPPMCQICGDMVGLAVSGDLFVACNGCTFLVCQPCYEYERKKGSRCCPQCKTRYKRQKGSPRVEKDEEEDGADDDIDKEFNYSSSKQAPQGPVLSITNGQSVSGEISDAILECQTVTSPSSDPIGRHVDWKERVESWKLKREKSMNRMANRIADEKGDNIERTGSNGEELQMYVHETTEI